MKTTIFDVLVVYSHKLAVSAANPSVEVPFDPQAGNEFYNEVYSYFLEACQKQNLRVAFTTSADVIGPGLCSSYWLVKNGTWTKVQKHASATTIFDKFATTSKELADQRALFFSSPHIKPFNSPHVRKLFSDKYLTYQSFTKHSIPSVVVNKVTIGGIFKAVSNLKKLMKRRPNDFSTDVIIKDRQGCGGNNIYRFKKNQKLKILKLLRKKPNKKFILQPFTKFDQGYEHNDKLIAADIRLVYLNGKIVDTYIRTAQEGNFLCNEHQGGLLTYVPIHDIPPQVLEQAEKILASLPKQNSLFSLDFVLSNNGNPYFIEGNTSPGLDWNPTIKHNTIKAKSFIHLVVDELSRRVAIAKENIYHPIHREDLALA